MRKCCVVSLLSLSAAALLFAHVHAAGPVTMFRGTPQHTGVADGNGPASMKMKWHFRTGGKVRSTPAVAGGVICFGSGDGNLYALDAETGRLRWKAPLGGPVTSSPAIAGGRVYVTGGDGQLHALALDTGKPAWVFRTGSPIPFELQPGAGPRTWEYFDPSPTPVGNLVYFGSLDGNVYAVDAATGALKWKTATGAAVRSTPAIDGNDLYVGSNDGVLYALNADTGQVRWRFKIQEPRYSRCGEIIGSPAVAGDSVYFGSRDGFLYALNRADGTRRWRADHEGSWIMSSPAVAEGLVVTGTSDGKFVQAVDAVTGAQKWRVDTGERVFSSPTIAGGVVYIGTWGGEIRAFGLQDGSKKPSGIATAAVHTSPVIVNQVLYVGSDDDYLYALK